MRSRQPPRVRHTPPSSKLRPIRTMEPPVTTAAIPWEISWRKTTNSRNGYTRKVPQRRRATAARASGRTRRRGGVFTGDPASPAGLALAAELHHDVAAAGARVEVDEDDLLPRAQEEPAVLERHGQGGAEEAGPDVGVAVVVVPRLLVSIGDPAGSQALEGGGQ